MAGDMCLNRSSLVGANGTRASDRAELRNLNLQAKTARQHLASFFVLDII